MIQKESGIFMLRRILYSKISGILSCCCQTGFKGSDCQRKKYGTSMNKSITSLAVEDFLSNRFAADCPPHRKMFNLAAYFLPSHPAYILRRHSF